MTVISLSIFRAQVDALISASDAEMAQINRDFQIKAAMQRYSDDNPLLEVDDVTGDGGNYYVITTALSSWIEGASRIVSVEYPAATIASDERPQLLGPEDWQDDYWADVSGTLTRHLFLPNHAPSASDTMRIAYHVPYVWTSGSLTVTVKQQTHGFSLNDAIYEDSKGIWRSAENTFNNLATHEATTITDANNFTGTELRVDVPMADFFAICNLAACLTCRALSAKYSRTSDSTISADSVNHTSRAQEFANRAMEFCDAYNEHMGIGDESQEDIQPAGTYIDLDTTPGWPINRQFIFHGANHR